MLGDIRFYNMHGAISTGEYPLVTGSETPFHTVGPVKYADGLQTVFRVPTFEGYDTVNVARLGDRYYWLTSYRELTTVAGQIEYTADLMAPTSYLRSGDTIKGSWHKLPSNLCPYLKNSITNGIMAVSRQITDIGRTIPMTGFDGSAHIYYYQISGYDANNQLHRIAGFLYYDERIGFWSGVSHNGSAYYPSFKDLITNVTACTGLLADMIIDFSISIRCPYPVITGVAVNGNYTVKLADLGGNAITPTVHGTNQLVTYDIEQISDDLETYRSYVTPSLSAYERAVGAVSVVDWNGNTVMSIPTQILSSGATVTFETIADMSGIYTLITCGDMRMCLPEGKLPYLDNNYESYKAYQMNTDRESMENAIKYAEYERDTQRVTSVTNGIAGGISTGVQGALLTGNVAGAALGILNAGVGMASDLYALDRRMALTRMQQADTLKLSERSAIEQPQTSYNAGYGGIYCALNERNPLRLTISTPKDITTSYYNNWIEAYGYPAEGVMKVTIGKGYYQGHLLDNDMHGMQYDALVQAFSEGFRFVDP